MALFDTNKPSSLEDVLGQQASAQTNTLQDQYAKARKKLVSQQASGGQLMSGNREYALGDLAESGAGDLSDIQSNLASALGKIPAEDFTNQNQYNRNLSLAELIGQLSSPSALQEALAGLSTAVNIGSKVAAFS